MDRARDRHVEGAGRGSAGIRVAAGRGGAAVRVAAVTAVAAATLVAAVLGLGAGRASAQAASEEEMKVYDADLGRAWIDVGSYPAEQRRAYSLFAQKCSKCHTLARPINSSLTSDDWLAYVARMGRKPGSGISPGDGDVILSFLVFDSARRERSASAVDPELLPFLAVSAELGGVRRFPASTRDLRFLDGALRIDVEGDPRLDLSGLLARDEGQDLVRWSRRAPNEGQIVLRELPFAGEDGAGAEGPAAGGALKAAVAEAIGTETDPAERVELLLDWLDANLAREPREGTPAAETILSERRGDATEFTALFVAMARAAGIDARTRVGLLPRRTALHLHPWAEVRLGDWTPVDPYLGELPAGPLRIRLAPAGPDALAAWSARAVPGLDRLRFRAEEPEDDTAGPGG